MNAQVIHPHPDMTELLNSLGVTQDRIKKFPLPGHANEDDLIAINERKDGPLCELVEGVLVEKPKGFFESRLAAMIIHLIQGYLDNNKFGIVMGADAQIRFLPGIVRLPDVSYISWEHFAGRKLPHVQILGVAPDLAIEVLSPSNTKKEMARKREEYFKAGTKCVWLLDPKNRKMKVYSAPDAFIEYDENQEIECATVLPGFRLSLRELFERAQS